MKNKMKHILILALTIVIVALKGFSQAPVQQAKNFELDVPMTWNASYEAKETITLKKGFSFTVNNNTKFSAKINASINSIVEGGNGDITQGLITGYTGPGGPADAPPGALPLVVDVSATGASTASMAFSFPQGFGGIAPQLGMSYSSQSSDGAFGENWNLTGISAITRVAQNYYYNDNTAALQFDNTDQLTMDGNRMFAVSGNLTANSTYKLESERFSKSITASATLHLNVPDGFTVVEKNGTTITYGGAGEVAKLIVSQTKGGVTANKVYAWLVSKITDARGNYIAYTYTNRTDGQIEVASIEYTGNTYSGLTPKYKVEFTYVDKEVNTLYMGGAVFGKGRCITGIKLSNSATSAELIRYDFTYTGIKLTKIEQFTKGSLACKPTIINWNNIELADDFILNNTWANPLVYNELEEYINIPGEFNGDNKPDILKINRKMNEELGSNDWHLLTEVNGLLTEVSAGNLASRNKNMKTSSYDVYLKERQYLGGPYFSSNYKESISDTKISTKGGNFPYAVADINNDGTLELCLIEGNSDVNATGCVFKAYNIGENELVFQGLTKNVGMISPNDNLMVGDFTGTGQIDIFHPSITGISESFTSSNEFDCSRLVTAIHLSQVKFNGDLKSELMVAAPTSIYIYEAKYLNGIYEFRVIATLSNVVAAEVLPGDYNGDGLTDILLFDYITKNWKLFYSNGIDAFIESTNDLSTTLNALDYQNYGAMEGHPDVDANYYLNHGGNYPEKAHFSPDPTDMYFDTPNDLFTYYQRLRENNTPIADLNKTYKTSPSSKYIANDFNGDGFMDIIRFERYVWVSYYEVLAYGINYDNFYAKNAISVFLGSENGFVQQKNVGPDFRYNSNLATIPECNPIIGNKIGNVQYRFSNFGNFKNSISVVDYNQDGLSEIVYLNNEEVRLFNGSSYNNPKSSECLILQPYEGENDACIASVVDGMGNTTSIQYGKSSNPDLYSYEPSATLPTDVYEPRILLTLVANKTITATSQVSSINYDYSTIRLHKQKGFLGFKSFTTNDAITKYKTVSDFGLNSTYFVPYLATQKQYKNNEPLSQVDNTFTFVSKTGKRYFQYLYTSVQKNVLTNQTITTENNYNTSYGYLFSQTQTAGTDGSVNTIYSGHSAANLWQPTSVRTTRSQNGTFPTSLDFTYDAYGNVLTSTDNDNFVTTYTYNNSNHTDVETITETAMGSTTTHTLDSDGRITKKDMLLDGKHYTESYTYNSDGQLTHLVDKNGLTSLYFYDNYGQLSTEVLPNGIRKAHTYGWSSAIGITSYQQTTDDVGNISTSYFDKLGRVKKQESTPVGGILNSVTSTYNTDGSVQNVVSSITGTTEYTYKTNGRLNSVTSMGKTTNYAYTAGTTNTNTNNISSSKTINAFGQLVKATDAGGEITYTYHASGNPETITTNGNTVTMSYDDKGRQISLTDPDAGNNTYGYNSLGQLTSNTDGNSNTTTNTYDALGRILTTSTVAGAGVAGAGSTRTLTYEYYSASPYLGYLKKVTDGESGIATSYTYDRLGRPASVSEVIKGVTYTFNYEFDAQGKVTRMIYPDGYAITQSYKDNGNYIDKIRDENAGVDLFSAYTYNKWGQVTAYTQGNGNTVANSYDETYGTIGSNTFGPSTNRIKYDYTFVPASGMLSQRSKQYLQNPAAVYTDAFTYDNLYRLTGWTVSQPNQANVAYTMDYSNNGNLVQKSDIGFYDYASAQPHAVSSVSQLSGDAFSTKYNKITYNSFSSVAKVELSATDVDPVTNTYTLTYGPDNQRRISNSDGAETIYVGLYEVRSNGDRLHYIPTPDGLCGLVVTNGATQTNYYLHNDHLGSLVAAEDQAGNLSEFSYDPWGRRRNPTDWNDYAVIAPTLFTRGFTGHEHMDAFGLINMNGRVYDPRLGRMLSPDKLVQAPDYSQSYNRYTYCFNNPLILTDPSGWEGEPLGYYDNGTPFWTTTDAYYYYEVNKRGYANGSDGMRSGYDYGFGGGWDTYDVVSNSFGNESWNGSVAGNIMGAYRKQADGTYASYNYNKGWVTMVEQHPMSEIGLNWNGNNLEIWYAPLTASSKGGGSSSLISSHYFSGGGELHPYDWKNDNIWYGTKVWFKHIAQGGKPRGTEYYNMTDLYKNYPISLWSGDAFGGSAKTRTNKAGISITINNSNPDYYRANDIGYISTSSDIDLENGVYRIWGKHPQHYNSVISVSFGNASDYDRWRKYIFGN